MNARVLALMFGLCTSLSQAAPFQDLDFDSATTNRISPDPGPFFRGTGPTEDLLPGWTLLKGSTVQTTMGLNLDLLAYGYATLISEDQSDFFQYPVEGSYALHLVGSPGNQEPFSLQQRGDIPAGAQFLSYKYSGYPLQLAINGVGLQPAFQSAELRAFDIAPFAGQTVDLTLTALGPIMPNEAGSSFIDSIAFDIPEPSIVALMGLATAGLGLTLRRKHRFPRRT
jgi:hypothetical protein